MPLFKKHPWLTGIAILLVLFFSLLPIALKYGASYVLEKQSGQAVSIEDIDLNLFTGNLQIRNIKLQNEQYSTQIKQFNANLNLRALLEQRLLFTQIELSGVTMPVEIIQSANKQTFKVAGFDIPQSSEAKTQTAKDFAIDFGVDQLTLQNIKLQLIQAENKQLYQIRNLSLNELYSWDSDFARLKLNSALNKKSINANLQVHLFAEVPKIIGTLKVKALDLHDLEDWVKQPLIGQLSAEMTFTIEQQKNGFNLYQSSDISLQNIDIQLPQQQIQSQAIGWQGDIHFFSGDIQALKVIGKLDGKQIKYNQQTQDGSKLSLKTDLKGSVDLIGHLDGADAKVRQNGLLSLTNFALQQQTTQPQKTDLAVNYQKFRYQGEVQYAIAKPMLNLDGSISLDKLSFKQQQTQTNQQELSIDSPQFGYQGKVAYDFEQKTINLNGKLAGEQLQLGQQNRADNKTISSLKLALAKLELDGQQQIQLGDSIAINTQSQLSLQQLALNQRNTSEDKASQLKLSNSLSAQLNAQANFNSNEQSLQQQGAIRIHNLDLAQNQTALKTPAINWHGQINWQQTDTMQLTAKGALNGDKLEFTQQGEDNLLQISQNLQAQLDLRLTNNAEQLALQQKGAVNISNLALQQKELSQLAKRILYDGKVHFTQHYTKEESVESGTQKIVLAGKLNVSGSRTELPAKKLTIAQNLSSDFTLASTLKNDTLSLDYQGSGQIGAFHFSNEQQKAKFDILNWQGEGEFKQNLGDTEQNPKLNGQFNLNLNKLQAGSTKHANAVHLKRLTLPSLTLKGTQHFVFKNLALNRLNLQGINKEQTIPAGSIKAITLNRGDINLAPALNLQLGDLTIDNLNSEIDVDKNYQVIQVNALLNAFGVKQQSNDSTVQSQSQTTPKKENALPKGALASFTLQGSNKIQLSISNPTDAKAKPINKTLIIKKLQFGAFDSKKPQQSSDFEFLASLDEFSEIRSSGKIAPLAKPLSVTAKTTIDGLALNDFSPLVQQAVGYQIDSGQLSAKIDSKIAHNKIDIDNDIKLYKFELVSANKEKTAEFNKSFSMPLEVGLSLLRDKRDNIELKLPVKGDLDNPNFKIQDVISSALNGALGKATRTYLLLALQPFGAIALVGEMALDQMSAVRLQPIEFEDASFKLNDKMQTYLQKVGKLLQSKGNVQIKLCGGVNQSDKRKIAESAQTETQKKENKLPQVTDNQLLRLATMRQTVIKRYLLEQGVSTNQIVICQPKIRKENGAAKIQIGI